MSGQFYSGYFTRERICRTLWRARWASEAVRTSWQTEEFLFPVIELGWSN